VNFGQNSRVVITKASINHDDTIQEIKTLNALQHPHIVRLEAVKRHENHLTMILEAGYSISKKITFEPSIKDVLKQVLVGLAYIHEMKYIHADLKPSNLITSLDGKVKIIDFGGSVKLDTTTISNFHYTPMYSAIGMYSLQSINFFRTIGSNSERSASCVFNCYGYLVIWLHHV
jgi:serine/threonine protein kinase